MQNTTQNQSNSVKANSSSSTQQNASQSQNQKQKNTWIFVLVGAILLIFIFLILPIIFFFSLGTLLETDVSVTKGSATVALIPINGVILTQTQSSIFGASGDTSSTEIVKRLAEIQKNPKISGVIFEINSPGGSGVASDEISQAIKDLNKPTVSYIREVGASGAYWVASSTDQIYANRMSTVGSIGVIASYLDFSDFLSRYNVSYQRFVAGDNKDFGSPFIEPTAAQEAYYQSILDELHLIFIEEVAEGRNLPVDHVRQYADGSIFTARQALDAKLIDGIGGRDEAIAYMAKELNSDITIITYQKRTSLLDAIAGVTHQGMYAVGVGIGNSITAKASNQNLVIQT
jgi:protease IV